MVYIPRYVERDRKAQKRRCRYACMSIANCKMPPPVPRNAHHHRRRRRRRRRQPVFVSFPHPSIPTSIHPSIHPSLHRKSPSHKRHGPHSSDSRNSSKSISPPAAAGMKKRPWRFSLRVLDTLSVLLVLLERRPRVVAAMISSGEGMAWWSRRSDGRT